MPFELRVRFAGLCVYVMDPTDGKLGVLMPDCRHNATSKLHDDGTTGAHHVGYLRVDLGSLTSAVPGGEANDGPGYEVVHRLEGKQVSFSPAGTGRVVGTPNVPKVGGAFHNTVLKSGLFGATPRGIVMRTVLHGGDIRSLPGSRNWEVADTLGAAQRGFYSGEVVWVTTIAAADVTLTLTDFAGGPPVSMTLHPVATPSGLAVTVKMANLCAYNPMEWDLLETHLTVRDVDFKWLFRVLQDTSATRSWSARLAGKEFPYPVQVGPTILGNEDCTGVAIEESF